MEPNSHMPVDTAADLIRAFGGASALAARLGVSVQAVSNMKARGSFPSRYWLTLMNDAEAMCVPGVSIEWLSALGRTHPTSPNSQNPDHTGAAA